MARTPTLAIRIVSDASKAGRGFADAETRVARFERGLNRASAAAAGVLGGMALVAKEAFDSASALEQSTGAVASVFGKQAAAVNELAKGAADAAGLSQTAYSELAAVMGSQLQNMGFAGKAAVSTTDDLIGVGADLAATFGGSTSDAVSALSSLLRGERDPVEKYGIAISAAAVAAKVSALGLDTSTAASKKNAEAQATLALVQEQSARTAGAFARESDTAAGAQQRAAASFENAKASLGDVLLPIVSAAAQKFAALTAFLVRNKTVALAVAGVVGGLAVAVLAVNAAVKTYRAFAMAAAAAQAVWNFAMAANPIGLVVLAVAAAAAAVYALYQKFEPVRRVVDTIGGAFKRAFEVAGTAVNKVVEALQWVWEKIKMVGDAFNAAGSWVGDLFGASAAPAGGGGGMYGAAAGAAGPMRGASLGALSGGGPSPSATGRGQGTIINLTINGALDPVAVGKQVRKLLQSDEILTGRRPAYVMGVA